MQPLDLIVRWLTAVQLTVSTPAIVCFIILLGRKWELFDKWQDFFKLREICYFCFCFWLSLVFGIDKGIINIIASTVIARTILSLNGI